MEKDFDKLPPIKNSELVDMAKNAISEDWTPCDNQTGAECPGIECHIGAHKALAILEGLPDETRILLTALKDALFELEQWAEFHIDDMDTARVVQETRDAIDRIEEKL